VASKRRKIPRRKPVQGRSVATVEVLLQTTAQILVSRGYEGATTNEIARRAGVSIGSLYQYFPDKAALLRELLGQHLSKRREVFEAVMTEVSPRTLPEVVRRLIHGIIEAHNVNPRLYQVLHAHADWEQVDAFDRELEAILTRSLREHTAAIRPRDPDLAAEVMVRSFAGLLRSSFRQDPVWMQRADVEEELVDLALRYLIKDGEG
jgi:AcrR family transcriptional regulator